MESIKLGGFTITNIENINNNFAELDQNKAAKSDVPTKVSQLTNDSNYQSAEQLAGVIKGVTVDDSTGIFTFTKYDGSTFQVDTLLEKVVTNFEYDEDTQSLVLTLEDGTKQTIPMAAFIDIYTGDTTVSGTITVTSDKKIKFDLANGAVTADKLGSDVSGTLSSLATGLENKVDKVEGKQLSTEDYTTAEKQKLAGLQNYTLPVGGDVLGGVKNGGNVTIGADGTMNVQLPGSFTKLNFTASDSWTDDSTLGAQTYKKLTLEASGKNPIAAFRKNGSTYEQIMTYLAASDTSVVIAALEAFEGYVICV